MTRARIALYACVALLAAACGGGGGGSGAPTESPQQLEDRSASASVAGLIGFAQRQIAQATSDAAEPRPVEGITPPTSDADEPALL